MTAKTWLQKNTLFGYFLLAYAISWSIAIPLALVAQGKCEGSDVTTLTGMVVDQAALHGVLNRIRDLNTALLSVQIVDA